MGDAANDKSLSRRKFLSLTGGALVAGAALGVSPAEALTAAKKVAPANPEFVTQEPFWGAHQGGILTPQQKHTYFVAFDIAATSVSDIVALMQTWTAAAARLTSGQSAKPAEQDLTQPGYDGGSAIGLSPERLTLTFGFGPSLFESAGTDRFGLKAHRPDALVDLPRFAGDQLVEARTGGDLSIQACADDPQVAFHAVRELIRLAYGAAEVRWAQTGFMPNYRADETPRNLMGFKDGTSNPSPVNPNDTNKFIWVGKEGPAWAQGGTYLVTRRIRIALEHWDRMNVGFQEQTIGRHKYSGAPIGGTHEFDDPNLEATDKDGNSVIPDNSHLRLANPASNEGARIFRRGYAYNDGVTLTAERWPPWHEGMEYDAGLLFVSYQRDPRNGFIKIFDQMSKVDQLNQFTTHVGSGIFICPAGAHPGEYIGQRLFEGA